MASRRLVSASARETLFGIPSDTASLERNYVLADDDLDLICTRRSAENRLGLAIHIALLRHPGQGWLDGDDLPGPLIRWLAEQVAVPSSALAGYGTRNATRSSHRQLAIRHLGLRPFVPDDRGTAIDLAAGDVRAGRTINALSNRRTARSSGSWSATTGTKVRSHTDNSPNSTGLSGCT